MLGGVALDNVTLGYDGHPAVHHLSGVIAPGAMLAIVGPNGAGKSTLLKGLVGELKPLGGRISHAQAGRVAYVPQKDGIDLSYPVPVFDLVAMGLWRSRGLFGGLSRQDEAAVSQALDAVGLSGFERRPVGTLSGGQLQRALFARVMLQDAGLILLDEPFAAIDGATVEDLVAVMRGWATEGRIVVTVLHDISLVRARFPQTLLIARHVIGWGATDVVLTETNLRRARGMREAFDDAAPFCDADGHAHDHPVVGLGQGAAQDHDHAHDHGHGHHHEHGHDPAHDAQPARASHRH
jgi:zinc/manganese transport system ATP-binding protein